MELVTMYGPLLEHLLSMLGLIVAYMTVWFCIALVAKRNDVADIAWGIGFIVVTWTSLFLAGATYLTAYIVASLVTVWGLRLAIHIASRNRNKSEDYRYKEWRNQWGTWFLLRSYLQVFLLQGLLLLMIVFPVLVMHVYGDATAYNGWFVVGILIWCLGFFFEVVGDYQLRQFTQSSENKGKLMTRGLWKYTRHPNYFGEVTLWWGIWIITIGVPGSLLGLLGPLTITVLILFVSGIPMLERKMREHPDFASYAARTSVFFPLPPRHK